MNINWLFRVYQEQVGDDGAAGGGSLATTGVEPDTSDSDNTVTDSDAAPAADDTPGSDAGEY